jgi:glutamate/tyrosine decarboxylase-like PLP-dependent enzyme
VSNQPETIIVTIELPLAEIRKAVEKVTITAVNASSYDGGFMTGIINDAVGKALRKIDLAPHIDAAIAVVLIPTVERVVQERMLKLVKEQTVGLKNRPFTGLIGDES